MIYVRKIKVRADKSGTCNKCGILRHVLCRDHIVPRREGGGDEPTNIQWLCANCHQDKTALEQSAAHKGRKKSTEQRAKMSAWQIGKTVPEEVRAKIRKTTLESMADPALRAYLKRKAVERVTRLGKCGRQIVIRKPLDPFKR